MKHNQQPKKKIAVIGSGVAGLSAAWLLNTKHNVYLYESDTRIGGHSNSVKIKVGSSSYIVDTGFIVFNKDNYQNFCSLLRYLNVPYTKSDMSFSASLDGGEMEYAATNLNGLFGQRSNIINPAFWRTINDLLRFYINAPKSLTIQHFEHFTLGQYLTYCSYNEDFIKNHLIPIGSAIWSSSRSNILEYPLHSFVRFFVSHGLFKFFNRPKWLTVSGGSQEYVNILKNTLHNCIVMRGVRTVERFPDKVIVCDTHGVSEKYDQVVIATHADDAYKILKDPTLTERQLLAPWRYTENRAILHSDSSLMPKRKALWSSWNFIESKVTKEREKLCVTYWMNKLQPWLGKENVFVTLNAQRMPQVDRIFQQFNYMHPHFDTTALHNQTKLWDLQGVNRTWFCGSYFGYGFHEDALQSGLAVAEQLGQIERPWDVQDKNSRLHILSKQRYIST